MKIIEINAVAFGSTGKIAINIGKTAEKSGNSFYFFFGVRRNDPKEIKNGYRIGNLLSYYFHYAFGKLFGLNDHLSFFETKKLVKTIKRINPDLIHLHIIHGQYLNIKYLFNYLKQIDIPIVWTFHDCWSFTGRCPHFQLTKCNKWKNVCFNCPYPKHNYPASLIDHSKKDFLLKKKMFSELNNLTIVTPSYWLASLTEKSFFNSKKIMVINNGIDLSVFKPTISDFRDKYNLNEKFIILGVANVWNERKGIDVFAKINNFLDPNIFQIVLVGDCDELNKTDNIIFISHTRNQQELAEIYTASNLFLNPTREDTFPTVNMEALACGTPVLTFKTGGSTEIIDENCGSSVECDDVFGLLKEIKRIKETEPFSSQSCINRAKQFDMNDKYREYIELFEKLVGQK